MKISRVGCRLVEAPDGDAEATAKLRRPRIWRVVTLRLGTDEGVEGLGLAFTLGGLDGALLAAVDELSHLLIGEDPTRIEHVLARLRSHAGTGGVGGLYLLAQAAIDMALWDIRGKTAALPLWRLAGGRGQAIAGYASGPVHRDLSDSDAAEAAAGLVERGFDRIKMHLALGRDSDPHRELRRARYVREAVGDAIHLGCDVNERWGVGDAIEIGRRLEEVSFAWLEDPTRHDDYRGLARISAALTTPVMAGENNFGLAPFRIMLEERSVSFLMIDVMAVGGVTAWLKVAGMAEAHNVPVVSHLLPEIQAHLVAGVPNGLMAEHKSWLWSLFREPPEFQLGVFQLSERPGFGLEFASFVYGDGW